MNEQLISGLEKLARLELGSAERTRLTQDLEQILHLVDQLRQLDTTGIEPLIHLNEPTESWRADEVNNQLTTAEALQNAPRHDETFFQVPKVIS